MRYYGKIIGVIFGIMSGIHIWGIIIGFIIGCIYDKVLEQQNLEKTLNKQSKNYKTFFFISVFQVLGHLTKAKGKITEVDIKLATKIMDKMQLHDDAKILAQNAFREGKDQNFSLRKTLKKLRRTCFGRFDLIEIFLETQIQAAFADDILHPNERKILFIIAEELGISYDQFEEFLEKVKYGRQFKYNSKYFYDSNYHQNVTKEVSLVDACKILNVQPNDERTKIKRAYHKLMAEHHPDKLIAKGLSQETMEIAKQKTQSIQAAYDLIKKERHFK
ncbi:MAG: co-chaperone DjlA [Arsenophonus sp. ET-DL9-MAG3]